MKKNCQNIMDVLNEFSTFSGLKINLFKSKLFISPIVNNVKARSLSRLSGISLTQDLGNYLGIPLLHKKCNRSYFQFIIDKIQKRLSGWKTNLLSMIGRATLIQSVTSALPSYAMQTMDVPISICKDMDRLNRNFLWGDSESSKKIHLVNWDIVCNNKKVGGLGLRKAKAQNLALMPKMGWKILSNEECLWAKVVKGKYLLKDFLISYASKRNSSLTCRGILKTRDILRRGIKWGVGDGSKIFIWHDWWCGETSLASQYPEHSSLNMDTVNKLMNDVGEWDVNKIKAYIPSEALDNVLKVNLPRFVTYPDIPYWKGSTSGNFSAAMAYQIVSSFVDNSLNMDWV